MGISLSIISGKGGCGKTTLALSISQLLAKSGCNVLLIDCDMSTHGATYFFEDLLKDKKKTLTVTDVFSTNVLEYEEDKKEIFVTKNFNFIPSTVSLVNDKFVETDFHINQSIKEKVLDKYDVVIYDCQAGFSLLTKEVTRITTKNLVVMELDSISSSSTRTLSTQLGANLEGTNTYQVLNKVTEEEFDVYYLVAYGTVYTNLTPIRYSLSIKKAFAFNQLPEIDMKNTSFTKDIFEVVYFVFSEYKDELNIFSLKSKNELRESIHNKIESLLEAEAERYIEESKFDYTELFYNLMPFLVSVSLCISSLLLQDDNLQEIFLLAAGAFAGNSSLKTYRQIKEYIKVHIKGNEFVQSDKIIQLEKQLDILDDEIEKLRNTINDGNQNNV